MPPLSNMALLKMENIPEGPEIVNSFPLAKNAVVIYSALAVNSSLDI
jgi:hypothetical protein